jgi:hypothetical protein
MASGRPDDSLDVPAEDRALLEHVAVALTALADRLESVEVRLESAPETPVTVFRAGSSPEPAVAALRGLSPLVASIELRLRGSTLPFVVFRRQVDRVAEPADVESLEAWHDLTRTLCHALPLLDLVEVYERGHLWRVVHDASRPGHHDARTLLAALGALGPRRVQEVRARVAGHLLATLYRREERSARLNVSSWKGALDALLARVGAMRRLDVKARDDEPWSTLYQAADPQRAREVARIMPAEPALVRIVLAGTGARLELAGPELELGSAIDELRPHAAEIVAVDRDGVERSLYTAADAPALTSAVRALVGGGPLRVTRLLATYDSPDGEVPVVLYARGGATARIAA